MAKKIPIKKKFRKVVIKIARREKPYFREVLATVMGDFAFHHTIEWDSNLSSSFTVTHIPSGLAVVQRIKKSSTARELVQALVSLRGKWRPKLPAWKTKGILVEDYSENFETKVKKTVSDFFTKQKEN